MAHAVVFGATDADVDDVKHPATAGVSSPLGMSVP